MRHRGQQWGAGSRCAPRAEPAACPPAGSPYPVFGKPASKTKQKCLCPGDVCTHLDNATNFEPGICHDTLRTKQATAHEQKLQVTSTRRVGVMPQEECGTAQGTCPTPLPIFGAILPAHGGKHGLPGQRGSADHPRQGCVPTPGQARPVIVTPTHSAQKHIFNSFYLTSSPKDAAEASPYPKNMGALLQPLSSACGSRRQRWASAPATPEDARDGRREAGEGQVPLLGRAPAAAEGELGVRGHSQSPSALPLHPGEGAARNTAS